MHPSPKPFRPATALTLAASLAFPAAPAQRPAAKHPGHAMVVTIQHDASDAGLAILQQGGNAVDAAVAVGFSLAVVLPAAGNVGGGGFMLARMKPTRCAGLCPAVSHFLDFRERAPMAATRDMYLDAQGNVIPGLSTLGYKASGVPGTVAGLVYAQKHFGKLTLAQDMAPAIRLATEGYVLSAQEAQTLHAGNLSKFPESRRIFQRDGNLYAPGETFKQPELARTLTRIAADPDTFYRGTMARELAADIEAHGGLITPADLAAYTVIDRKPLIARFTAGGKPYSLITSPPPSSGGIALIETLNILGGYDLPKLGPDRSEPQVHIITEAFRRAYMDRADYLGDPDYTSIPIAALSSPAYAAAWRATIDPNKPTPSADLRRPAGFVPPPPAGAPGPRHESPQTTHFSIVDADGNAVAMTYTLNGLFGSGVTATGLGFLMNNEMDDFSSKPGSPNMFGLIQGPANAIAPGHRPLSSMTPTLVVNGTRPEFGTVRLVLGSPGGATIITTVANDLLSILINGLPVQAAADAPRFHHQYLPDVLDLERAFPALVADQLRAAGYPVSQANQADEKNPGTWGDSELISIDPATGALSGGQDHRHTYGKIAQF